MDINKEFDELDCDDDFFEELISQNPMTSQSQQKVPPPVSQPLHSFITPSNPKITGAQTKPSSSFDRVYSQKLTQAELQSKFNPKPPNRFIHKDIKPEKEENFGRNDIGIKLEPGSAGTGQQPFKILSPEREVAWFGPSISSKIPVDTKEAFIKVETKPTISSQLRKLSKPATNLLQNLDLYPTLTFLFEAISHWEKINCKAPSLSHQLPRSGTPNPFYSRQPTWKVKLLQRIASEGGSSKPVLECLLETLQLLFLSREKSEGYNKGCKKTALTIDQLKYQTALVELRDNLVLLFDCPGFRLRHLPPQLHAQFQQNKIKFIKSFGECLLWLDGLGRVKDITFLVDVLISASNTIPTLFGDTLIGQRSLINGILFPLCKILSKANTPEKEKCVLPIELASQIPDRLGTSPAQSGPRTPPLFVVTSILQFLKLLATKCPPPCLDWFTCLLEDADILKLLTSDRLMLQTKLSVISLLTHIVVSPKVFPLLIKGEPKDSVHFLGVLLEWAIDNEIELEELCDLGEGALEYIYTIVVEYPSSFNNVFGYREDKAIETSILFPLVAFITQVCDSQSSLLSMIREAESSLLLFPHATRLQRIQALDSHLINHGRFFSPSGASATHLLVRSVKLIEVFLQILEGAVISDDNLCSLLRTHKWLRPQSLATFSSLDGMNLFYCLYDLLGRLKDRFSQRTLNTLPKTEFTEFIEAPSPYEQDKLYLTPLINDMALGISNFIDKNLKRSRESSDDV